MGAGTEVGFYHLTRSALEPALGRLLERVLESGLRAVVRAASAERVEALNRALWQFGRDSFLPHGTRADGSAEDQPVFLTDRDGLSERCHACWCWSTAPRPIRRAVPPLPLSVRRQRRAGGRAGPRPVAALARARHGADLLAADRARLAEGGAGRPRAVSAPYWRTILFDPRRGVAISRRGTIRRDPWPSSARSRSSSPTPPGAI